MIYRLIFKFEEYKWHYKYLFAITIFFLVAVRINGQNAESTLQEIKQKLERVSDYEASGKMKTNVAFIKAPIASIKVYYKKPDKLRIINEKGISFIPKGSVNIS